MKVGILTFHEVFNPGAFFQTLGSVSLLEQRGHEVTVIDYTPPSHRYSMLKMVCALSYRLPFRMKLVWQSHGKAAAFARDRRKWMRLSQHFESHEQLLKEHFDAVCIGADIVWHFDLPALGRDPVYFGHSLNTERLIAFAPSVGHCVIDGPLPQYVCDGLREFHAISVRDAKSGRLVESVTGVLPPQLCDPAFHLNPDDFLGSVSVRASGDAPYLLVYLMGHLCSPELIAAIQAFAKSRNLKVISTLYPNAWADEDRVVCGPIEWLRLIREARYIVTNTFHGTVFSMMLGKDFAVQYTDLIRSKTEGMLEELGLKDRIVTEGKDIEAVFGRDWDRARVRRQIDGWRVVARTFLERALEGESTTR